MQGLMGQFHHQRGSSTSTHRVNLGQHCYDVSAQHFPSLPEDVAGKGVSLLGTWDRRREKEAGEHLGTACPGYSPHHRVALQLGEV